MEKFKYFFSYARGDSEFVLKLAKELRAAGANLWLDQLDILGGQRWDRAVEEALKNCQGMIAVLSPDSLASDNVMDEVSYALEEGKLVVPLLLRSCDIPFRLRRVQHIDFTANYETGFSRLVKALRIEHHSHPPESAANQESLPRDHAAPPEETPEAEVEIKPKAEEEGRSPAKMETETKYEADDHQGSVPGKPVAAPSANAGTPIDAILFLNRVPLLLSISTAAYTVFAAFLLNSGGSDREAGYMFMGNALALILGSVVSWLGRIQASRICGLGSLLQVAILIGMLSLSIGDAEIVIPLNLAIAAAFSGMMALYARHERRHSPANQYS